MAQILVIVIVLFVIVCSSHFGWTSSDLADPNSSCISALETRALRGLKF